MGKRYICWLLAFLLALPLTACGAAAPDQSVSAPTQSASASAENKELTWQELYDKGAALRKAWEEQWEDELLEEAVEAFSAALALEPDEISLLTSRGDAYASLWDLDTARTDYEAALTMDEACVPAHMGMVDLLIRQKQFDAALEMLETASLKLQDDAVQEKLEQMRQGDFYDADGHVHRMINMWDMDGNVIGYSEYEWNGGEIVNKWNFDGEGNPTGYTKYLKDDQGVELGSDEYDMEGNYLSGVRYVYDENGEFLRYTDLDQNGEPTMGRSYVHDDQGRQLEYCFYEPDGSLWHRARFDYDGQGNILTRTEENFDDQGRPTQVNILDGQSNSIGITNYFYDDNGNEIRREEWDLTTNIPILWLWQYDDTLTCEWYIKIHYDDTGKPAIAEVYSPVGEMVSYYTYINGRLDEKHLYDTDGTLLEEPVYDVLDMLKNITW